MALLDAFGSLNIRRSLRQLVTETSTAIRKSEIDNPIAFLKTHSANDYHKTMNWLEKYRFDLTSEQCEINIRNLPESAVPLRQSEKSDRRRPLLLQMRRWMTLTTVRNWNQAQEQTADGCFRGTSNRQGKQPKKRGRHRPPSFLKEYSVTSPSPSFSGTSSVPA